MTYRQCPSRYVVTLALALMATLTVSCSNPCEELSEKICKCKPTEVEQQSCIVDVGTSSSLEPASDSENEACSSLLDAEKCTCENLAKGELAACGLAAESHQ